MKLLRDALYSYTNPSRAERQRAFLKEAAEARNKLKDAVRQLRSYRKLLTQVPESLDQLPFGSNDLRREVMTALVNLENSWSASAQFLHSQGSLRGHHRDQQLLYEIQRTVQEAAGRECFVELSRLLSAAHNAHLSSSGREELPEYSENALRMCIRRVEREHPEMVAAIDDLFSGDAE